MNNREIASKVPHIAKEIAGADSDYIYDPEHKQKPGGKYDKTEKGWSLKKEKKEKPVTKDPVEFLRNEERNRRPDSDAADKIRDLMNQQQKPAAPPVTRKPAAPVDPETKKKMDTAIDKNTDSKTLDAMSRGDDKRINERVAANPNTALDTLQRLSGNPHYDVRYQVARNKNIPEELLTKLSEDRDSKVRTGAAMNPTAKPELLEKLSNDPRMVVRYGVISNRNVPKNILEKLSKDPNKDVNNYANAKLKKQNAAPGAVQKEEPKQPVDDYKKYETMDWIEGSNLAKTTTDPKILDALANNKAGYIPSQVSMNPNTSAPTLERLSKTGDSLIRERVAKHPNTENKVLENLTKDTSRMVSQAAKDSLEKRGIKQEESKENYETMEKGRALTLSVHATDPKVLDRLSNHTDSNVGYYVALNPHTSGETLEKLSKSENDSVRENVATNKNTPIEVLKNLSKDKELIRNQAEMNLKKRGFEKEISTPPTPKIPRKYDSYKTVDWEKGMALAEQAKDPEALEALSQNESKLVRSRVAENPNAPLSALERLTEDEEYQSIKLDVLRNPKVPREIVERLSKDDDSYIRSTAKEKLKKFPPKKIIPGSPEAKLIEKNKKYEKFFEAKKDSPGFYSDPETKKMVDDLYTDGELVSKISDKAGYDAWSNRDRAASELDSRIRDLWQARRLTQAGKMPTIDGEYVDSIEKMQKHEKGFRNLLSELKIPNIITEAHAMGKRGRTYDSDAKTLSTNLNMYSELKDAIDKYGKKAIKDIKFERTGMSEYDINNSLYDSARGENEFDTNVGIKCSITIDTPEGEKVISNNKKFDNAYPMPTVFGKKDYEGGLLPIPKI